MAEQSSAAATEFCSESLEGPIPAPGSVFMPAPEPATTPPSLTDLTHRKGDSPRRKTTKSRKYALDVRRRR